MYMHLMMANEFIPNIKSIFGNIQVEIREINNNKSLNYL